MASSAAMASALSCFFKPKRRTWGACAPEGRWPASIGAQASSPSQNRRWPPNECRKQVTPTRLPAKWRVALLDSVASDYGVSDGDAGISAGISAAVLPMTQSNQPSPPHSQPCLWLWTTAKTAARTIRIRIIRMQIPSHSCERNYTNRAKTERVTLSSILAFVGLSHDMILLTGGMRLPGVLD